MAWCVRQNVTGDVTEEDFEKWVETYVFERPRAGDVTTLDLYAARCAMLRTSCSTIRTRACQTRNTRRAPSTQLSLTRRFAECRQRLDKTFDHALEIESDGCRDGLLDAYDEWVNRQIDLGFGWKPFTLENISPSPGAEHVTLIVEVLKRRGVNQEMIGGLLLEFLNSKQFRNTPVNKISTRLFASIAHAAANGQRRPPDQGMANDIDVVSAYLPYCDAMLIDNRVRAMLTSLPKRHGLDYPCRVFSRNNGDDFLAYLRSIEQDAAPLILSLVHQVYGQDWPRPFLTMYDVERRRAKRN